MKHHNYMATHGKYVSTILAAFLTLVSMHSKADSYYSASGCHLINGYGAEQPATRSTTTITNYSNSGTYALCPIVSTGNIRNVQITRSSTSITCWLCNKTNCWSDNASGQFSNVNFDTQAFELQCFLPAEVTVNVGGVPWTTDYSLSSFRVW